MERYCERSACPRTQTADSTSQTNALPDKYRNFIPRSFMEEPGDVS